MCVYIYIYMHTYTCIDLDLDLDLDLDIRCSPRAGRPRRAPSDRPSWGERACRGFIFLIMLFVSYVFGLFISISSFGRSDLPLVSGKSYPALG